MGPRLAVRPAEACVPGWRVRTMVLGTPLVSLRSSAGQSTGFLDHNWASRGETARRIRSNSGNAQRVPPAHAANPEPSPAPASAGLGTV